MTTNDFAPINPETLRKRTEEELVFIMGANAGGAWDTWARAEMARRQNDALGQLITSLRDATERVQREVGLLANSSGKLENLTITLKNLTWALIVLTFLAAAVAIGIEIWKSSREVQAAPVSENRDFQMW